MWYVHGCEMKANQFKTWSRLEYMVGTNGIIHYRQKIWNTFYLIDFLHFCGKCRVFLYLKYIHMSRYYFWGSYLALNSKMKCKGSKTIISVIFSIRLWLEFLFSLCQIAAISIRVLYRDIVRNAIVYLPPILVRSAGELASCQHRIEGHGK